MLLSERGGDVKTGRTTLVSHLTFNYLPSNLDEIKLHTQWKHVISPFNCLRPLMKGRTGGDGDVSFVVVVVVKVNYSQVNCSADSQQASFLLSYQQHSETISHGWMETCQNLGIKRSISDVLRNA